MKLSNAKEMPKRYYALHMAEGVCEYRPAGAEPFRVFLDEEALKKMDPTFEGRPLYVGHIDKFDLNSVGEAGPDGKIEEAGYVIRSFYNPADGRHWSEFLVVSDKGHEAIRNGWKVSNCYTVKNSAGGGQWHNVDYKKKVLDGEYEHLALVQRPRYEESIVLTPEEFKEYNRKKELELKTLSNSKEELKKEKKGMLNFFKRERLENSADFESTIVELPKSKKSMSVAEVVTKYDERLVNGYMCNGDEMVSVGDGKMSVNELVEKHMEMKNSLAAMEEEKKKNASAEDDKKKENEVEEEKKKENEAEEDKPSKEEANKNSEEEDKKENEEDDKKQNSKDKEHFLRLKNAAEKAVRTGTYGELSEDRLARGKNRYGSN